MKDNGIVDEVTHVFATHKQRTYLTVLPVAEMAGVDVQRFPTSSSDNDEVEKLEEEASICPTVQAIKSTTLGSTIVMSSHLIPSLCRYNKNIRCEQNRQVRTYFEI